MSQTAPSAKAVDTTAPAGSAESKFTSGFSHPPVRGSAGAGQTWRGIPFRIGDTAQNMALSKLLVQSAGVAGPAVWWHASTKPTLVVGPHGARSHSSDGHVETVVRPTGGAAVLASSGLLGLDIVLPASSSLLTGDVVLDYKWVGHLWQDALARLGVSATVLDIEHARVRNAEIAPSLLGLACFASVSPFELTVEGRKLIGLSQVRRRGGVLIGCAIHIDRHPSEIASVLAISPPRRRMLARHLAASAVSLSELVPSHIGSTEVIDAFTGAMRRLHCITVRMKRFSSQELSSAMAALSAERRSFR
jgi:lipoate-protein ligase A